jgi:hypothetical protein
MCRETFIINFTPNPSMLKKTTLEKADTIFSYILCV